MAHRPRPVSSALAALVLLVPARAQDVSSANRAHFARVAPEGTSLEVRNAEGRVQWRVEGTDLAALELRFLSNDGQVFAAVDCEGASGATLVRVFRGGRSIAALDARALGVPEELLGAWLAVGPASIRLREASAPLRLDLLARDERVRSVDLVDGKVIATPGSEPVAGGTPKAPRVVPAAAGTAAIAYLSTWLAPEVLLAGEPLLVHVRGNLPTPAHRFAGFCLETGGPGLPSLRLTPRVLEPASGTLAPQVLQPFDETARVEGLVPGRYRVAVFGPDGGEGAAFRDLVVLPAGLVASFERVGGIAGIQQGISLHADGRVVSSDAESRSRSVLLASDAERAAIDRIVAGLPKAPARKARSLGSDLFAYAIVWTAENRLVRVERDDLNLEPELRVLIDALDTLARDPESAPR
jgi:hypothetical protein